MYKEERKDRDNLPRLRCELLLTVMKSTHCSKMRLDGAASPSQMEPRGVAANCHEVHTLQQDEAGWSCLAITNGTTSPSQSGRALWWSIGPSVH